METVPELEPTEPEPIYVTIVRSLEDSYSSL